MAIRLYGSWFSPFARKVALALELKALPYDYVDGLLAENRAEVYKLNPRGEVPVLADDAVVVINSSDIVQYLDWRYPEPGPYPAAAGGRGGARARAAARLAPRPDHCRLFLLALDRAGRQPARRFVGSRAARPR